MKIAAIDCGTNSVHLLIAHMDDDGRFDVVYDIKDSPRLGEGVVASGVLSPEAMTRTLQTLSEYREICHRFEVERIRCVATSAVRRSLNQAEFAAMVERGTGVELEIVSGREEARLVALACSQQVGFTEEDYLLFNVGGGSTELVLGRGKEMRDARSAEIGAVSLTERFLKSDPPKRGEVASMEKAVARELKRTLPPKLLGTKKRILYGSGGTLTNLLGIRQALRYGSVLSGTFFKLRYRELREIYLSLLEKSVAERRTLAGLNPARADIIAGGAAVVKVLMEVYGFRSMRSVDRGLKHGIIVDESLKVRQSLLRSLLVLQSESLDSATTPEIRHALKVRDLALEIFDAVAAEHGLDAGDRNLLALAALLHDIGLSVEMRSHHKHTYRLIMTSDQLKLPQRERELVALIARYHRRAFPSSSHKPFASLDKMDRRRVLLLGAIVRLADGFDRSHSQAVDSLGCRLEKGQLVIDPRSRRVSTLDCLGAEGKSDLFEEAFGRQVVIRTSW